MDLSSKIYVAGHAGLVGNAVCRLLQEHGYTTIITHSFEELDLRRQGEVEQFFAHERPEYVVLAAAKVGGILANSMYKAEFIYDNLMIAANVIHASYRYGVKKLLNLGSSCIYPKHAPQPMKEEYLLTAPLEETNEPYALAKIAAIKLCRYYNEQYGTQFISAMPTNLYGPHDNFNLETAHLIPALIRKFHLAKLLAQQNFEALEKDCTQYSLGFAQLPQWKLGDEKSLRHALEARGITATAVTLWGTGIPYREFLYVSDLARAALFLINNGDSRVIGECINVGCGSDIRIHDLALLVRHLVEFEGDILYDATKPDGTPRKLLSSARITAMGWQPQVQLKDGIMRVYEWYEEKFDVKKKDTHTWLGTNQSL